MSDRVKAFQRNKRRIQEALHASKWRLSVGEDRIHYVDASTGLGEVSQADLVAIAADWDDPVWEMQGRAKRRDGLVVYVTASNRRVAVDAANELFCYEYYGGDWHQMDKANDGVYRIGKIWNP